MYVYKARQWNRGEFSTKYCAKTRKPTGREIDIYRQHFLTLRRVVLRVYKFIYYNAFDPKIFQPYKINIKLFNIKYKMYYLILINFITYNRNSSYLTPIYWNNVFRTVEIKKCCLKYLFKENQVEMIKKCLR